MEEQQEAGKAPHLCSLRKEKTSTAARGAWRAGRPTDIGCIAPRGANRWQSLPQSGLVVVLWRGVGPGRLPLLFSASFTHQSLVKRLIA
jgi:hypothetical protein